MTVRQYIGARYVPLFADPIQWDSTSSYEPLTVVMNEGTSYVSKQSVPAGIQITNETYWLRWADYNAQLEEYIRQVQQYNERIQQNATDIGTINDALPIADFDDENTVKDAIDSIAALLPSSDFSDLNTVKDTIDTLDTAIDARLDLIEANGWVTNERIADNAVTSGKIANGAVYNEDVHDGAITNAKIYDRTIEDIKLKHNEVIVIFGDSWSDPTVADAKWPETIRTLFNNAVVHNYAKNGCHTSNGTFASMYQAFVNDTSWDKSTITRVIFVYGVNDCFTYPITYQECGTSIQSFYNAVIGMIPDHVPIHWFINHAYGKHTMTFTQQMYYWHALTTNIQTACPRLIPYETWSWFNVNEYNQSNFFHLTQNVSRGHFAKNIYACMTGGEPLKYTTYTGDIGNDVLVLVNVTETNVQINVQWTGVTSVINHYLVEPSPSHFPIEISSQISAAKPNGFCKLQSGSSDAVDVNRVTFVASASTSDTAGTLEIFNYVLNSAL